jgi:hypothetical protein
MTFILHMLMIIMLCMGAIKLEAEAGLLAPDEGTMCMFNLVKISFNFLPTQDLKLYIYIYFFAVDALLEIATQVGKKDWNNNVDPCSNETSWVTPPSSQRPMFDNKVVCNCSFGGVCHIVSMYVSTSLNSPCLFCLCLS